MLPAAELDERAEAFCFDCNGACNEASLLRQVRKTALHGFTAVFAILDSKVEMILWEAANCRHAQDACAKQLKVLR